MSALRTYQYRTEMTSPKCEAELRDTIALRKAVKR
jgi:hypothetical protein